ncbi:MAG: zinc dependent phospholipase C family protein, partial [Hadesarchaea archaeon]|nr:zinc dependent phospholipase C family protein [Hadesarchaea archaeon]
MQRASSPAWRCFLIPLLLLAFARVPNVQAWSWGVHREVASTALELLPGDARAALSSYRGIVIEWSVMPDVLKSSDWYEQYRHWYHVDSPHGEREYWEGVLPWAVEYYFEDMIQALRAENLVGAAQLAGRLSHYIADASMPLHATKYYDGVHSPFERAADAHLGELDVTLPGYSPRVLENVFGAIVELLERSYGYSEEVRSELYKVSTWTPKLREITEAQLRAAVALTADVWYTAYVEATSPTQLVAPSPLSPSNGAAARSSPTLRWSTARGVAPPFTYEVLLDDDPNFPSPRAFLAGSATELALPELEDGEYYWRVLVRDALGNENLSDARRFLVDSTPPPAPM